MAKANESWKVLPHGPVEKLTENLLRVEGSLDNMPLKRVMAVAKRSDGKLVVHNGIGLDDAAIAEIEAFGTPSFLVVPNGWHRLDAKAWKARYPQIAVVAPRGSKKRVGEVVAVDMTFEQYPADEDVKLEYVAGVGDAEGVMIVRSADGVSLVFTDMVFNMPHLRGLQGFVLKHVTQSSGGPRISRIFRLFGLKDERAFRADIERLAATPGLRRVLVAHHETITDRPADALRRVAAMA